MYLSPGSVLRNAAILLFICIAQNIDASAQQKNSDNTILSIDRNKIDNSPSSISFSPSAGWRVGMEQEVFSRYLGIKGGDDVLTLKQTTTTKQGITVARYTQYYKGIKAEHGSYVVTSKEGIIHTISGNIYDFSNSPSITPSVREATAFNKALQFVGAEQYKWQIPAEEAQIKQRYHKADTSYLPHGVLVWVENMISDTRDKKPHLAWYFDVYAAKPLTRQQVYIDAQTGEVLFSNQMIKHTATTGHSLYSGNVPIVTSRITGPTYVLYDSTRGSGVHTMNMHNGTDYGVATEFLSPANTWPNTIADSTAIDAQWGGEMVYDYWLTEHGRHSWDDLDGILVQYVHYDVGYNNAYWDGAEMTYGDGTGIASGGFSSLTSLDVTGHEIGHGVCEATAGLIYEKEPGAMNEGLSDCWGATIEHWADPHEVDARAKQTWKIGEEIDNTQLRSMDNPNIDGNPDTYGGLHWTNVVGCTPTGGSGGNDYCGVHNNSGVLNYWYYLLTQGGSGTNDIGNAFTVSGVGWTKAPAILYQTELMLTSTSQYTDCRTASINAATILYGACSPEVQSVTTAWYAVGVGPNYVPCTPQIGFAVTTLDVSENAGTTACPASHTVLIGLQPMGLPITVGSPTANIVTGGTAVPGVDYTLSATSVNFPTADPSTQYITMTVFDNGAINDDKTIKLAFTLTAGGSVATISPTNDTMFINLYNDDSIPQQGGIQYRTLNIGPSVTSNNTSAFFASRRRAHSQFLLYASELREAGIRPGAPISQIAFTVTAKNSTTPFTNYSIRMGHTTATDLSSGFATGTTQMFLGAHTSNLGTDSVNFNTSTFTWNGTDNVIVEVCFGMNASSVGTNDQMAGIDHSGMVANYNSSNMGTGTGCSLGSSNLSTARPVMRFKQTVPPTPIETTVASTRTWDVRAGQEVYYYSTADVELIAGVQNPTLDLGCATGTVSQGGTGFMPASFSPINRSAKDITIAPSINGAITTSNVTMYLTNTELAGVTPSTLFLVRTTEPTDATVNTSNSVVLTPTVITGTNYVGFKGTFTGYGRYFLVDGPICNKPDATITAAGPTTFCLGSDVTLNANTGSGLTYQWKVGGGNIPGATTSSYVANAGGSYQVVVSQGACDSTSLATTVSVDSAYAAPITGTAAACIGLTTTLSDITTGGVWTSTNTAVGTVGTSGIVTGIAAGTTTISYAVTNACGTGYASRVVTVSAGTAVAAIGGTFSLCAGTNTTLTDATSPGVWSSTNTATGTISSAGVVTGLAAGTTTISYSVTNGAGCTSAATAVVTVNATIAATTTPSGSAVICSGSDVTLTASPAGSYTYRWQESGTNIPGATLASYTANAAGNYRVVVTSMAGCSGTSAVVAVSISTAPVVVPAVSIAASPGLVICSAPIPVTYTATPANGGVTPAYQWYVNGSAISGATNNIYTYTPANGDIVKCELASSAPCAVPATAINTVTMLVSPNVSPSVSIDPVPNDTICAGDVISYTAIPVHGGTAPTYVWSENGINVATGYMYITAPHDGDIIICRMTSNFPCLLTPIAVSAPFTMHVLAPSTNTVTISASSPSVAAGGSVSFTAAAPNAGAGATYQWYIDGVAVAGATMATFTSTTLANGQVVTCRVASSQLCTTPHTASSAGITMHVISGVNGVAASVSGFTLQPNPNKGAFTISGTTGSMNNEEVTISITNMLGQTVHSSVAHAHGGVVNEQVILPNTIASGMYLVGITTGTQHVVFHVTIDK